MSGIYKEGRLWYSAFGKTRLVKATFVNCEPNSTSQAPVFYVEREEDLYGTPTHKPHIIVNRKDWLIAEYENI